ncbi:MAG TPA: thioredoxin domain-containing protein [Pseudomonadota bacterium]|nr:thioredoxin domain-containing protein [Pseudomonadota bacterium]
MTHSASFLRSTASAVTFGLGLFLSSAVFAVGEAPKPAAPAPAAVGEYPGLDIKTLSEGDRGLLKRLLEKFPSACGKPHSLAVSLRTDPSCKLSGIASKWLLKMVIDGFLESEIEEKYSERYLQRKCYSVDIAQAPVRGDAKAPVTIIEFSDFECPACRAVEPMLKQVLAEYSKVRLVFMNYPLPMHPNAMNSAMASVAAGKQGKFWSYHDKLFENQDKQTMADLVRYAMEMKLDVTKFQADMQAARERVEKDRAEGKKVELTGTPGMLVNGCKVRAGSIEELRSYIDAELAK